MAIPTTTTSTNTVIAPNITVGEFMTKYQAYLNDPNTVNLPSTALLDCLPDVKYTPSEIAVIKASLIDIQTISSFYESPRINNIATEYLNQFDKIQCLGEDAAVLFNVFYDDAVKFIEFYESVKNNQILKTDVNQNPNYYNN